MQFDCEVLTCGNIVCALLECSHEDACNQGLVPCNLQVNFIAGYLLLAWIS